MKRLILATSVLAVIMLSAGRLFVVFGADAPARIFKLTAETPQFWNLIDHNANLTKVAGDFGFTEGPVWDDAGFLYVSDEEKNKIYRVFVDGRPNGKKDEQKKEEVISLGDPDGSTYDRKHRLIDCASVLRAIIAVTPDGKYTTLADHYEGKKFNSPNDVITKDLTQPNGLAFSPDGKKFYVDDSEQRNIRVYDVAADGTLSNGRIFGLEPGEKHEGVPDGIKVDTDGNLFVTGPKGIWVWDPQGHHLGTIEMPEQPANLAWGDKDSQTLYITATTSVYSLRLKAKGFVPYLTH